MNRDMLNRFATENRQTKLNLTDMKHLWLTLLLSSFTVMQVALAQNLVPNPSFEEYTSCPDDQFGIEKAVPWTTYSGTPDLFNACDTTGYVATPTSELIGTKVPFDGVGQAGFIGITFPHWREILGVSLTQPLNPGTEYFVSFQVARVFGGTGNATCDCAMNNIGLKFLMHSYSYSEPIGQDNHADVNYSEVIADTASWTQISGWFTADSAYTHIAIGNFFDNDHNTLVYFNDEPFINTYYFVDAVCVAADPADCEGLVPVNEAKTSKPTISLYPNPTTDYLNIYLNAQPIHSILVMDTQGRMVKSFDLSDNVDQSLYVGDLSSGVYLVKVRFQNNNTFSQTIIKL